MFYFLICDVQDLLYKFKNFYDYNIIIKEKRIPKKINKLSYIL